jgi:hypothetical protein
MCVEVPLVDLSVRRTACAVNFVAFQRAITTHACTLGYRSSTYSFVARRVLSTLWRFSVQSRRMYMLQHGAAIVLPLRLVNLQAGIS